MSYEVSTGTVAFGEPLIESGFSAHVGNDQMAFRDRLGFPAKLCTLASRPDLIIRPAIDYEGYFIQELEEGERDFFTEEILFLDELGLKTPGISQAKEPYTREEGVDTVVYYVANRVEGLDFGADLEKIPESVAVDAYESILSYYEAVLDDDEGGVTTQRFWDVALRQLKYGTTDSDLRPQTYLVDIDEYMYDPALSPAHFLQGVVRLINEVNTLEAVYGKEFSVLRKRSATLIEGALVYATQKGTDPSLLQMRLLIARINEYLPYASKDTHPMLMQYAA